MHHTIDPHLYGCIVACSAAQDVIEMFPDTDLVCDLEQLLDTQNELFVCFLQGKHFGTNQLNEFYEFSRKVKQKISRLKEKIE